MENYISKPHNRNLIWKLGYDYCLSVPSTIIENSIVYHLKINPNVAVYLQEYLNTKTLVVF